MTMIGLSTTTAIMVPPCGLVVQLQHEFIMDAICLWGFAISSLTVEVRFLLSRTAEGCV
jgi:hypothetical protein